MTAHATASTVRPASLRGQRVQQTHHDPTQDTDETVQTVQPRRKPPHLHVNLLAVTMICQNWHQRKQRRSNHRPPQATVTHLRSSHSRHSRSRLRVQAPTQTLELQLRRLKRACSRRRRTLQCLGCVLGEHTYSKARPIQSCRDALPYPWPNAMDFCELHRLVEVKSS